MGAVIPYLGMYRRVHGTMTEGDFYSVLGVSKTASREEINDAFRRKASQFHPDRNKDQGAAQRFKELSEAYSVLSDPGKRHLYDVLGPDRYDDPREVLFHRLNREAANLSKSGTDLPAK